jgi:SAM-dependent methyltransferase
VGVTGRVLATDIDPRFLQALSYANLEVCHHDIRSETLPPNEFDLAHVRLVLMHLPDWRSALRRMVEALKPGGWIVVEEFDDLSFLPDPSINPREISLKVRHAFQQILTARGVNLRCGRLLPQELKANGLANVGGEANISIWSGHSAGTDLLKLSCQELREPMLASGLISQEEFEADLKRVDEQDYLMPSPMMWTAWGRKAGSPADRPNESNEFIYW